MQTQIYRRLPLILATFAMFAVARPAHAQTYDESVLFSFCKTGYICSDGQIPLGMVIGSDGNLYGVTEEGGVGDDGGAGQYGSVYKFVPGGELTTLYTFCSLSSCADGEYPQKILQGADGNFYGTTDGGGAYGNDGTIFKITPAGALLTLYSFCSQTNCADGAGPVGLLQGTDGNFYGITNAGGANAVPNSLGAGTVFKLTPAGALTILYNFCSLGGTSCTDGYHPGSLLQGTDGNFYGTTNIGGAHGDGTIFKLTPAGAFTTLYSFQCQVTCSSGEYASLRVQGTSGNLYDTTEYGGASGFGTIFETSLSGALTSLYSFCSQTNCPDGQYPSTLLQVSGGSFFGTTLGGGAQGGGTIFQLTPSGTLTTLYSFCSQSDCSDGESPYALVQNASGGFYGTTFSGGAYYTGETNTGAIFEFTTANTPSTTTLTANGNPVGLGGMAELIAQVTGSAGTPTGSVTFSLNGTIVGSATLSSSEALIYFSVASYPLGTYTAVASYAGNSAYESSQSSISLVISKDQPYVALTATPNPAQEGQPATLTATVSGTDGTPTGTVNFTVNGTAIGSAAVNSSGVATLTASTNKLPLGTYPVVATYTGNSDYTSFQSSALDVVLEQAATSATLTGAPNPVTPPASITLIAAVQRSSAGSKGVPTGTVTFYYGTAALGTVTLNESAEASLTAPTKGLAAGTYPITVKYNGDADDATSTSAPLYVTVN